MQGIEIDFKDGQKRRLVFGVKQASLVEKEFGNTMFLTLLYDNSGTFRFISHCIWAGLQRRNQPEIHYEEVCDLIEGYMQRNGSLYTDLLTPIIEACQESGVLGRDAKGEQVPNVPKEAAPDAPSPSGGTTSAPQS